jgi:hypothetical protein
LLGRVHRVHLLSKFIELDQVELRNRDTGLIVRLLKVSAAYRWH